MPFPSVLRCIPPRRCPTNSTITGHGRGGLSPNEATPTSSTSLKVPYADRRAFRLLSLHRNRSSHDAPDSTPTPLPTPAHRLAHYFHLPSIFAVPSHQRLIGAYDPRSPFPLLLARFLNRLCTTDAWLSAPDLAGAAADPSGSTQRVHRRPPDCKRTSRLRVCGFPVPICWALVAMHVQLRRRASKTSSEGSFGIAIGDKTYFLSGAPSPAILQRRLRGPPDASLVSSDPRSRCGSTILPLPSFRPL
ncbi:hypothetical protein C8R44DRAFT_893323 [Mycena epipterygia]|nr:hypothetical protein C8R44DRAFT_893323 [Mycena epipterygia]